MSEKLTPKQRELLEMLTNKVYLSPYGKYWGRTGYESAMLKELEKQGLVTFDNGWMITDAGRKAVAK